MVIEEDKYYLPKRKLNNERRAICRLAFSLVQETALLNINYKRKKRY